MSALPNGLPGPAGRLSPSGLERAIERARRRMTAGKTNVEMRQGNHSHYTMEMMGIISEMAASRFFGVAVEYVHKGRKGPAADLDLPDGSTVGVKSTLRFSADAFLLVPTQNRRCDYYLGVSVNIQTGEFRINGYITDVEMRADYVPGPFKEGAWPSYNMPISQLRDAAELRRLTAKEEPPEPEPTDPGPEPEPEWTPPDIQWRDPDPEGKEELEPYDPREHRVADPRDELESRRMERRIELARALYPLIDGKGKGPFNTVKVGGRMATVKQAFSCQGGVAVVFARERETVRGDKLNTPIMRFVDVEDVEVI